MTSGTINRDNRAPDTGYGRPGCQFYKTWNGTDWPKLPKPQKPILMDPVVVDRKGRRRLEKAILANNRAAIERYKEVSKSIRQRNVRRKRERRDEHHPYEWLVQRNCDDLQAWVHLPKPKPPEKPVVTVGTWTNAFGGGSWIDPGWSPGDDYALIERLKTNIIGSEFNLGVFLAEAQPALAMIFNASQRLALALKALKRGDIPGMYRHLRPKGSAGGVRKPGKTGRKTLAQHWLEAQYGWMPLVSDLDEGARMLAHMTGSPFTHKVKSSLKKPGRVTSGTPSQVSATGTCVRRGQLIAYLKEVNVPQLLGLTDFASILWERTPYSFVADWAIPIGNFLAARGIASALTGTFVTTRYLKVNVTGLYISGNNYSQITWGSPFTLAYNQGTRVVDQSLQVPRPQIVPFGEMLSWKRAANAVALLVSQGSFSPVRPARRA